MARVCLSNFRPASAVPARKVAEQFDDWSCCEPQTEYELAAATFEQVPTAYAGLNKMQQIAQMRRQGRVDEAYAEAHRLLMLNAADPYARIAMAWCIKALCEQASKQADTEAFVKWFGMLEDLKLTEIGERAMHNRLGWDIYKLLDALKTNPERQIAAADRLFAMVRRMEFNRPDKYYSIMLEAFAIVKGPQRAGWPGFLDMVEWWGWHNLTATDFLRKSLPNKRVINSIAERALNACYRSTVSRLQRGGMPTERVQQFIDLLTEFSQSHPEFQYTLYQKASLLLILGRRDEARASVLAFAKANQDRFWVWDILADTVDEPDVQLSCYCRALSCRADDQFLSRVRLKAAALMHQLGFDGNARAEIRQLHSLYSAHGWHMPRRAVEMKNAEWYQRAEAPADNAAFYRQHLDASEALLFSDQPEVPVLVYMYNKTKHLCHFLTDKTQRGFFFARGLKTRIEEYGVYMMRYDSAGTQSWQATRVYSIRRANEEEAQACAGVFFKQVKGPFRRPVNKAFGFVDDAFVEAGPLASAVAPGTSVRATAALTFRLKTQQLGWNVIHLEPIAQG